MKLVYLVLAAALFASSHAKAEVTAGILTCSSSGFALASLEIDESASGGVVWITESEADDAPTVRYSVVSGLKDVIAGTSATLIANGPKSKPFSDAMTDSLLIRILDGQKRAIAAFNGNVYRLNCTRN